MVFFYILLIYYYLWGIADAMSHGEAYAILELMATLLPQPSEC